MPLSECMQFTKVEIRTRDVHLYFQNEPNKEKH